MKGELARRRKGENSTVFYLSGSAGSSDQAKINNETKSREK